MTSPKWLIKSDEEPIKLLGWADNKRMVQLCETQNNILLGLNWEFFLLLDCLPYEANHPHYIDQSWDGEQFLKGH